MIVFNAIFIAVIVFLLSVTLILFIVGPTLLLTPRRRTAEFYRKLGLPVSLSDVQLIYEDLNVIADGGIKLNGWLVKAGQKSRGTIIYLHGVGDCKMDGIRFTKLMHENNYNVFLYDSRRHGESDGEFCTYGFFEKNDLVKVIDYLQSRNDLTLGKIALFGTSMGAAVALQTAGIDRRISAVIAENSFATLRSIFDDYQKRMIKLPFHYLRNIVIKRSELKAGFKANSVSPVDSLKAIRIPVMIIYGTEDHLISHQYSLRLFDAANEPKEFFAIEGAKHNDTWQVEGKNYETRILRFLERHIG